MRVVKEFQGSHSRKELRNDSILKQGTGRGPLHCKPNLHREILLEWPFLYYRRIMSLDDFGQFIV